MTQTATRLTLTGAKTIQELRVAIAQRVTTSLFNVPQIGATLSGVRDKDTKAIVKPLRVFKGEGNVGFLRSNGKSTFVLRTNSFTKPQKEVSEDVKALINACDTRDELFEAFTRYLNDNTLEANIWSDNPNLASIFNGASIEGTIIHDTWTDVNTGEPREKIILDRVKDITIRQSAQAADEELSEDLMAFCMADDTAEPEPAKPTTGKPATKAGKAGVK